MRDVSILLTILIFICSVTISGKVIGNNPDNLINTLNPAAKTKVFKAAKQFGLAVFSSNNGVGFNPALINAANRFFPGLKGQQREIILAAVLHVTVKMTDADLKEIKISRQKVNSSVRFIKNKTAQLYNKYPELRKLPSRIKTTILKKPKSGLTKNFKIEFALPDSGGDNGNFNINAGKTTIQGLRLFLDKMKSDLDNMNEMSEMTSLRLQMTMDRRSKFISTLSNLMKKISTTQDPIVQNIK